MDSNKNIEKKLEDLKYIKTNRLFGEKNIPKCLENIHENCKNDYNNIKLQNYNITRIEENLYLLNKIFDKLYTAYYSGQTFHPKFVKLLLFFKGKDYKTFGKATENQKIKSDINMSLKTEMNTLNRIINYLDKNEKNELIHNLKNEKCNMYCEKNNDCINSCNANLNRFDILINIIKIYEKIKDKLDNKNLIEKLYDEISEIKEIINKTENKPTKDSDDKLTTDNEVTNEKKNEMTKTDIDIILKYLPGPYEFPIKSKQHLKDIITKLNEVIESKKKYINIIEKKDNVYNNCIKKINS